MTADEIYRERNQVVAGLARAATALGCPVGLKATDIPSWDPEWHNCVYIDLPGGQVSWHFHDRDFDLFSDLPPYTGEWDGHDTPEKYRRVDGAFRVDVEDRRARVGVRSKGDWV